LRLAGGEIKSISGAINMDEAIGERSIAATMQFCSGTLGTFLSYSCHAGKWEMRIHGDGVEAHLNPLEQGTIRIGKEAPIPLPHSDGDHDLKPGLREQALAFVEALQYLGTIPAPGSDLFDHACTLELVEQILDLPVV
jgi:hypothetical protein